MVSTLVQIILSFALAIFIYPSAILYPFDTLPDRNDTRLIAYIVNQVQDNILQNKPLYHGSFFASEPNTLTYSDLFLTSAVTALPIRIFTNHPIFVFNFVYLFSLTLTIFSSFIFFKLFTEDKYLPIILSLFFNLSGFHLHYYAHLQIFSLWIFFSALTNLIKYLRTTQIKYLHFFFIFTTLQLAESIFTTYLLFFASVFLIFPKIKHCISEICHLRSVIYIITWLLLLLPYLKTHLLYPEASRPIRDAAHFALGLDSFYTLYLSPLSLFILLITIAIAMVGIPKTTRSRCVGAEGYPAQRRDDTGSCEHGFWRVPKWLLLFSIVMSLGPVLKIFNHTIKILGLPIPLPYTLFYYLFPGFTGFRTPSRFIILVLFSCCLLLIQYLSPFFEKIKTKTKIIILIFTFTLLSFEAKLPLTGYPVNITNHPVYDQVKNLPQDAVILELPIKLWNDDDNQIESIRSLYSLYHEHRRLGGYSGFATYDWIKLVQEIQSQGLTPEIITKLKSRGLTHIIIDNKLSEI